MDDIGRAIFEYRKRREMSQTEFAEIVGVHWSYLNQIENGHRVPSKKLEEKIKKIIKNY